MEQHDNGARKDLVKYRIRSAKEDLKSAQILLEAGSLKAANNRAYYAIFHAINAIHALHGAGYKRHKDAIANFNKEYVKTEIFPREIGRRISEAEEIRHASDYDDFYIATVDEAKRQIETADMFLTLVETYCQEQLGDQISPKLLMRYRNSVRVTELKKVVVTTTLEVRTPSCPIFLDMM